MLKQHDGHFIPSISKYAHVLPKRALPVTRPKAKCKPSRLVWLLRLGGVIYVGNSLITRFEQRNRTELVVESQQVAKLQPVVELPQQLKFGDYKRESASPFIGPDIWVELVDNRRTFFLRPDEKGFPSMKKLQGWIRSMPYPITLVFNNQNAKSWPDNEDFFGSQKYKLILEEEKLHVIYTVNPRKLITDHDKRFADKLKPLPGGMKWQYENKLLFGEQKRILHTMYSTISTSGNQSRELFKSKGRTTTVWVRPMAATNNAKTENYIKDNNALQMSRSLICPTIQKHAPKAVVCDAIKIPDLQYFEKLQTHRFVVSPAGRGLDAHSTWEAMFAGCIPIVPRSSLASLYEDLPVWLVDSWEEVTDEAVERVEKEMLAKVDRFKWEKLFAPWWKEELTSWFR